MLELLCYLVVFIAEGITTWAYFDRIYERKGATWVLATSFSVLYAILFAISQIGNILLNCSAFFLFNFFLLYVNFKSKIVSGLLQVGVLTFVMCFTEIIAAMILTTVSHDFAAYSYDLSVMIAFTVISRLMFFFGMQIIARLFSPSTKSTNEGSSILLLAALPVSSVLIALTIIYIGMTLTVPAFVNLLMILSVIVLLFVNILVMVIYNRIQKISEERLSYELRLQSESSKEEYYEMLQEQYENQRILIHDINSHFNSLQSLVDENKYDDLCEYIKNVSSQPSLKRVRFCDEPVLNSILTRYVRLCEQSNIRCNYDIRCNHISCIDKSDITALFDNLLSNAYEAAKQVKDSSVSLSVTSYSANEILIKATNSCSATPMFSSDGRFISQKRNKGIHGIGTQSISKVALKYNGDIATQFDDKTQLFTVVISLKIC